MKVKKYMPLMREGAAAPARNKQTDVTNGSIVLQNLVRVLPGDTVRIHIETSD